MIPSILKHDQDSCIRPSKIPKNDIKRFLPGMFVNAINSGDFQHIQNVLFSFLSNQCTFKSDICFPPRFHAPSTMNSTSAQLFIHYLLGWHVMFPDTILTLKESKLVSHSYFRGTIVEMDIEYNLTKAAHIPNELWIPPLLSTVDLYKTHTLQDMLYTVHLHTAQLNNNDKSTTESRLNSLQYANVSSHPSFQGTDKGVTDSSGQSTLTMSAIQVNEQTTYSSHRNNSSSRDGSATSTQRSSTVHTASAVRGSSTALSKSNESVALLLEAHATISNEYIATREAQALVSLQWPSAQNTTTSLAVVDRIPTIKSAESAPVTVADLLKPIGPLVVPPVPADLPPVCSNPLLPPLPLAQLPTQARIPDRFVDDLHAAAVLLHSPLPLRLVGQYVLYLDESNHIVHITLSAAPV